MTMNLSKILSLLFIVCINTLALAQVDTCNNRITSLTNNDEDSWIVKANDGKYYVSYFSDSSGSPAIWITRSINGGLSWDSPWVAIQTSDSCFYPCIAQASNGVFHMVWFRIGGGSVAVWYSHSTNTLSWSTPVKLTNTPSVDWLPTLVIDYNDKLWVTFASDRTGNMDIYSIRSTDLGATWSNPVALTTHPYQDNLPTLFQKLDSSFILTWQRYNSSPYDYLSNTSEIYYKTSPDGINWSAEDSITWDTNPLYTDVLPSIYQNPVDSEVYITWTSNRISPQGNSVELSLSSIIAGSMGNDAKSITCNGYYARTIPADTLGQFIMTWVADPDNNGQHDIYSRFLNKTTHTASINDHTDHFKYSLFPNPLGQNSTLTFEHATKENCTFTLYNTQGQVVQTISNITTDKVEIERKHLTNGLYFFQLRTETKLLGNGKLVIE